MPHGVRGAKNSSAYSLIVICLSGANIAIYFVTEKIKYKKMEKIIGLDLGTNSIGLAVRDFDNTLPIIEQIELVGTNIFPSGVGKNKSGEFSYATARTKKRTVRRMYQARKYRIWATLELLIKNNCCPLSIEDLDKWRKYDKRNGLKRKYPINAVQFEQWVRCDFGDGIETNPYKLRYELMNRQFDLNDETERMKFGRALYHIAQRRGFKSSKGETISDKDDDKVVEKDDVDVSDMMKKSEEKTSSNLVKYMTDNNLPTVGCAFYNLISNGVRVRNSDYKAVRSQYKDEIKKIFEFQNQLDTNSEFYKHLVSEKKSEGTIFYKRPPRSQKGLVGKCTLEPSKDRCPVSHPDFEKFRAWCFINTIKFGQDCQQELTIEQKKKLFNEKFMLLKSDFKFEEIRQWITKETHIPLDYNAKTIKYKDRTSVSGCPVSARLKKLLGDNWQSWKYETSFKKKNGETKHACYDAYDLWHVCFSFDDVEYVEEFAKTKLNFNDEQTKLLVKIFDAIKQGYAMLSLKAIRNINRFLEKGYLYSYSALMAKLPEIFGEEKWAENESKIVSLLQNATDENRKQKTIYYIVNSLIANYKSLEPNEQFARNNPDYLLDESDKDDVAAMAQKTFGEKSWQSKSAEERNEIIATAEKLYQEFFASSDRDYYKLPKLAEALADCIKKKYDFIDPKQLKKIYHPSMIEIYAPAKEQTIEDGRVMKLLGSPVIGALKNPMAMRVLHSLRRMINKLLTTNDENGNPIIDENTRVVVETARELNDANMRWAIETYQKQREAENKVFEEMIKQYTQNDNDVVKVRLLMEQTDNKGDNEDEKFFEKYKKNLITKYRLWTEQKFMCLYTGNIITISDLFAENAFDIEHTIPRSKCFDDSLANLTICDAHFNRTIKKNQIPSQLNNYDDILSRIQPWKEKVEHLKDNVEYWKAKSKRAMDKDSKDKCIRQKHLWQTELDYWKNKVERFELKEVTDGFRNSQLVDTRIITKYAYHYLKTVFNKVEVQKAGVNVAFRKMLGIQIDEKKSRDKHSHHAIDAATLTLIPTAAQRDKMLELFFKKLEGYQTSDLDKQLNQERRKCGLGVDVSAIVPYIENNILINHQSKDQTLTPAHRRKRIRGKIVPNIWLTGDCLRGKLHGESFYGAIRLGKKDTNGKSLLRNPDGSIVQEEEVKYVIRRELKFKKNDQDTGFKSWDELEKVMVDKALFETIKSKFPEGTSFKDACEAGITDPRKNKIRHVRCFDPTVKNPLAIKKQTYLSKYSYKQNYYAAMGDLYVMCKYENISKTKTKYIIWSLFDISENRKGKTPDIEDIPTTLTVEEKHNTFVVNLVYKIHKGDMVLLYENTPDELVEADKNLLSQRLYVVTGFENPSRILMVKHINAQKDSDLGKGEALTTFDKMPEKIRQSISKLNFLLRGKDFDFSADFGIVFK